VGATPQTVDHGATAPRLTAVPDANSQFASWTGDYVGSDNPLTITNVTADMTITASFLVDTYTVTFAAGPQGSLQGDSPQTVDYGANCTAVTAVPTSVADFTGWTGDYVGDDNPLTIANVAANMTITATFGNRTHTVTFVAGELGSVQGAVLQEVDYLANCTAVIACPMPTLLHRLDRRLRRRRQPADDHQRHDGHDHHRQLLKRPRQAACLRPRAS